MPLYIVAEEMESLIHYTTVRFLTTSNAVLQPRMNQRSSCIKMGTSMVSSCLFSYLAQAKTLVDIAYSVSSVGGNYALGGSVIEFRDVTEENRIERERMNAMLLNEQQSARIKESDVHKANMTSFVSFVCHELRNPLQGIMGSTEFLLDTLQKLDALSSKLSGLEGHGNLVATRTTHHAPAPIQLSNGVLNAIQPLALHKSGTTIADVGVFANMESLIEDAKQLVKNIQTCAEHQALITNNVLDLSRLDAGKVEPTYDIMDVYNIGPQTVGMMQARAQHKNIKLALAKPIQSPLYLKADATILSQVLLNFVSNAIKVSYYLLWQEARLMSTQFTPENGTIMIDMWPELSDNRGQTTLHFTVTDTGLGLSEAEQQRLFQRFSQANRRY